MMGTEESTDDYEPSPKAYVRDQVRRIESSGGRRGTMINGRPCIVVTQRGVRTGKIRKVPVMRVEHEGKYVAVASQGGAPRHPNWYFNLKANPDVTVQDGVLVADFSARELDGDEKALWWQIATEVFPNYALYQQRAGEREIPVFLLEPRG